MQNSKASSSWFLGCKFVDIVFVLVVVFGLATLSEWRRLHPGPSKWMRVDETAQIGAEYDTIAQAIRAGRGFSDPFHEPTGPTAWMPPLLVYFTAGLYWLTGDRRELVVPIIRGINILSIAFGGLLVVGYARRIGLAKLGVVILALGLLADFAELFQRTGDTWLLLLLIGLCWLGLQRGKRHLESDNRATFAWGLFGGCIALASPIAGMTWALSTAIQFWVRANNNPTTNLTSRVLRIAKSLSIAALASVLVITPWMVRNRTVMGQWIPIKSNGMYEIWQSQVLDDDGILDSESAYQHPWGSNSSQRQEYVRLGELAFVQERAEPTWNSIRSSPLRFLGRISNRFFAATMCFYPMEAGDEEMTWTMKYIRAYFPLPLVSVMVLIWLKRTPLDRAQLATLTIYLFYLSSYVAISYYARYAAPIAIMKMLLILHAVDVLRDRTKLFARRNESGLESSTYCTPSRLEVR